MGYIMLQSGQEGLEGGDTDLPERPQVRRAKGRIGVTKGNGQGAPEGIAREGEEARVAHVECDASVMGEADEACSEGVVESNGGAGVEAYREVAVRRKLARED